MEMRTKQQGKDQAKRRSFERDAQLAWTLVTATDNNHYADSGRLRQAINDATTEAESVEAYCAWREWLDDVNDYAAKVESTHNNNTYRPRHAKQQRNHLGQFLPNR